jgi:prepilin-type N-terminal cleavage/methylation domain-containing protein/prepilin-type processing-associated H-X9-DG protein
MSMARVTRTAFTLIELLVVVAIAGLLLALLFPSMTRALEQSRRSACRSNLRDLGVSLKMFATDHNGWYVLADTNTLASGAPRYSYNNGNPYLSGEYPFTRHGRKLYTNNYVASGRVFVCPSDKFEFRGSTSTRVDVKPARDGDTFATPGPNAFNSNGNCSYMYIAGYGITSQEDPSRAGVLLDESNEQERGDRSPGQMPDIKKDDNHGANYRNVLYFDGHVVSLEGDDVANTNLFGHLINTDILNSVD